jgi:hypothetical protein
MATSKETKKSSKFQLLQAEWSCFIIPFNYPISKSEIKEKRREEKRSSVTFFKILLKMKPICNFPFPVINTN